MFSDWSADKNRYSQRQLVKWLQLAIRCFQSANLETHQNIYKAKGIIVLALINSLFDHSRQESGEVKIEREDFEVHELVSDVQNAMSHCALARDKHSFLKTIWIAR